MALCSLNLLIPCNFGYCFMSDSAVLETLKYSAYSCVPICTDSTSAKANTGLLPVILPRHQSFSCIYGMGVLIVSQSSGVWFLTTLYLSLFYVFFFWLELESNSTFRFGRVQRNKVGQLYYGHVISSLYILDLYMHLKDSYFLLFPKYTFRDSISDLYFICTSGNLLKLNFYSQHFHATRGKNIQQRRGLKSISNNIVLEILGLLSKTLLKKKSFHLINGIYKCSKQ